MLEDIADLAHVARHDERRPRRTRATAPVAGASVAVSATKWSLPGVANSATVAADSAAVADIEPTMRWRELASAA
jgi:hypothetical protein